MMVAMREETQDLVVKKCIALVLLFIFFYFGGHTCGTRLQVLFRIRSPTTLQFFKSVSHHVGNRTRKKVIRLIHHIHSTHEHQAHGLCMLRLTQIYTNWYAQQQQQFYFFSLRLNSLTTDRARKSPLFCSSTLSSPRYNKVIYQLLSPKCSCKSRGGPC